MSLDLAPALRDALIDATDISSQLSEWRGEPAVFTRRPVPADAVFPFCIVNPDSFITDQDGLTSPRPVVGRDIAFYGRKGPPGDASDQTRIVEAMAYLARDLFHREKFSVQPTGFSVIDVVATGPVPAPVDDEATIGRLVSLTIRLRRNS